MQPEQPATPANEPAVATETVLPVAQPILPVAQPILGQRARAERAAALAAARAAQRARELARTRRFVRAALLAVAAALTGVFVAAFRIHPYDEDGTPRTMSTHTQLGMPPCSFEALTGKPCPSCGMTTSFALLVRGDVVSSMRANWVGSLICVLWALTLVWAAVSGVCGKPLLVPPGRGELVLTVTVGVVLALMLARWAAILIG